VGFIGLTLALPPSTNNLYSTIMIGKKPRRVKSERGLAYCEDVRRACLPYRMAEGFMLTPPLSLSVKAYMPDLRQRDLSNLIKCLEDSLAAGLGFNDSQVEHLEMWKLLDRAQPRVEVTIREIGDAD
jgi:Holliday junction resolvase RusA-like endonuclease